MRSVLQVLTALAVGAALLGAPPAQAAAGTWLYVHSSDPLVSEDGDGIWESATVTVGTDAEAARWELISPGGQVAASAELTAQQLNAAGRGEGSFSISSATTGSALTGGTWTFSVTTTATGKEPVTRTTSIHVLTSPLPAVTRSTDVFYPRDQQSGGVARTITFRVPALDPMVMAWGSPHLQIVSPDGSSWAWGLDEDGTDVEWNGWLDRPEAGYAVLPAGDYQARLAVWDGSQRTYGSASPFRLSWAYRILRTTTAARTANATRTATLTQRRARVRAQDGSLLYRAFNTDWRRRPLVRTAHRVRIPRDGAPGFPIFLVVRGAWQYDLDPDLEIVLPDRRVRNIDIYESIDRRSLSLPIPRRWIHADGTLRFRLLWSSHGPTGAAHRIGRTDTVGVQTTRYVWRGPA